MGLIFSKATAELGSQRMDNDTLLKSRKDHCPY
jgi:hypothetical protein